MSRDLLSAFSYRAIDWPLSIDMDPKCICMCLHACALRGTDNSNKTDPVMAIGDGAYVLLYEKGATNMRVLEVHGFARSWYITIFKLFTAAVIFQKFPSDCWYHVMMCTIAIVRAMLPLQYIISTNCQSEVPRKYLPGLNPWTCTHTWLNVGFKRKPRYNYCALFARSQINAISGTGLFSGVLI